MPRLIRGIQGFYRRKKQKTLGPANKSRGDGRVM